MSVAKKHSTSSDDDDVVIVQTTTTKTAATVPSFSCYVKGDPVSQARVRVAKLGGAYYDKKTTAHKKKIQETFKSVLASRKGKGILFPKNVPVRLAVTCFMRRPLKHFVGNK